MTRRFFASTLLLLPPLGLADTWVIDGAHSSAQFAVRHMMVTTVRGSFGKMSGIVNWDAADPARSTLEATVDVTSINTGNEKRDSDLRGPDFFDVAKFPSIVFKSTRVEKAGDNLLKITGDLTMHGVTRPVVFTVEGPTPPVKAGKGVKMGATGTAKIKRSDFGITWNRVIEAGGVTVSDEVTITVDLELNKQS
jgi:polyisoprenoid-binding protein YceI